MERSVSFVIPCLNEEKTLPVILEKITTTAEKELTGYKWEIVLSDNGSTDRSIPIAESFGARIVNCSTRGYGAALLNGIKNAASEYVIFADADDTYDFTEAPLLIREMEKGYDMVIGSRLQGKIGEGAMPFLHRYLGTPMLNRIINTLYASNGNRINDCNSGFRCFKREVFEGWGVRSTGMEFASEMLVKALKNKASITHIPVSLNPDHEGRVPHLKTWKDGMRHLIQILMEAPSFFFQTGSVILAASYLVLLAGLFHGPLRIMEMSVFGIHSMIIMLLAAVFGVTLFGIGLGLYVRHPDNTRLYAWLLKLTEDKLFWAAVTIFSSGLFFLVLLVIYWAGHGFRGIDLSRETLFVAAVSINGIQLISSVIFAHMIKRF